MVEGLEEEGFAVVVEGGEEGFAVEEGFLAVEDDGAVLVVAAPVLFSGSVPVWGITISSEEKGGTEVVRSGACGAASSVFVFFGSCVS